MARQLLPSRVFLRQGANLRPGELKLCAFDVETSGTLPEFSLQPWRVRQGKAWLTALAWVWREDGATHHGGSLLNGVTSCNTMIHAMLLWRHLDIEPEYEHKQGRSYSLKAAVPLFFPKHAGYEADIDYHGTDPAELLKLHEYNVKDCFFTLKLARKFWEGLTYSQQTVAITEAASFKMIARANLEGLIVDTLEAGNLSANLKQVAAT